MLRYSVLLTCLIWRPWVWGLLEALLFWCRGCCWGIIWCPWTMLGPLLAGSKVWKLGWYAGCPGWSLPTPWNGEMNSEDSAEFWSFVGVIKLLVNWRGFNAWIWFTFFCDCCYFLADINRFSGRALLVVFLASAWSDLTSMIFKMFCWGGEGQLLSPIL